MQEIGVNVPTFFCDASRGDRSAAEAADFLVTLKKYGKKRDHPDRQGVFPGEEHRHGFSLP
jgi:hypothetical protein